MGSYVHSGPEKMLANLTSLFWGSENSSPALDTTIASPESPEPLAKFNIRATTPADDEEADWVLVDRVLVDRVEVGEARGGEGQALQLQASFSATTTTATTTTAITTITTINLKPASSIPLAPMVAGGDLTEGGAQEWLMTPPPCFTRSQAAPLTVSPLEDLLIEHPSMSVYLPRPTYTSTASARIFHRIVSHSNSPPSASPSSQPASAEREESPMREDGVGEGDGQVVEAAAPRTGVAHRSPSLLQAIDVLRPAQKAQRRREERRLKRTPLERSNKARQVAAEGNKRAKRRDMMTPGKFSRAVNNRKC